MSTIFSFYVVAAAILANGYSLPAFGQSCLSTLTAPTNERGVNRLERNSNIPLFRMSLDRTAITNVSKHDARSYAVKITAENSYFPFSEAKISIASKGQCGIGFLTFDTHHFFDALQTGPACPRLLLTNQKPMVNLPSLIWTPPSCGCVSFRAIVITVDRVHYKDNEVVQNGPLTQTVCVHQKATRELYLNALCHTLTRYSAAEIISRAAFLQRHQIEARWIDKHGLEMGLELRRSDNKLCCSKASLEDQMICFDDSRRRRVDRFCEDGYPDIPLTSFRLDHMRTREKHCCFLLGEHRYTCFAQNSDIIRGPTVTLLDFSQDETDPVNDLAEFASLQDADVVKSIETVTIGESDNKDSNTEQNDKTSTGSEETDRAIEDKDDITKSKLEDTKVIEKVVDIKPAVEVSRSFSSADTDSKNINRHGPVEGSRASSKETYKAGKPSVSSSELRQATKKNREYDRISSSERRDNRKGSSKEYTADGRRASGERKNGRKRSSAERQNPAPVSYAGYDDTYSRGTGLLRERDRVSSTERRMRGRASAQRRHDWTEVAEELDFEDQEGGKSVDVTLNKLQKQMDRLLLRRQCCIDGAAAGDSVYGWLSPVRKECEHSRQKYMAKFKSPSRVWPCLDQFLKCCIEQAVSGPVVTSSEFRDRFPNSQKRLGPLGGLSMLDRKEDDLGQDVGMIREEISRDIPGRETPEIYEFESDKRFKSMREIDDVPKESIDDDDGDEINGPKQFDEVDNSLIEDFDIFDRKDDTVNKTLQKFETEQEIDDLNDKKVVANEDRSESEEIKVVNSTDNKKSKQEIHIKKESKIEQSTVAVIKDKLDRESDLMESWEPEYRQKGNEDPWLSRTWGGRSTNNKNSRAGGRSRGGRIQSREYSQQTSREGRSSLSSQERRRNGQHYNSKKRSYNLAPYGKIGTQDSQEMVAAHARKYLGSLDSKEMVDAYRKIKPELSDSLNDSPKLRSANKRKYRKQRWQK